MPLNTQSGLPIEFTQGDTVSLYLIATDNNGDPVDLTDAVLTTQILGPNSVGPIIFPDAQHTIANQTTDKGKFQLDLSSDDTAACGLGPSKQIITEAVIGGMSPSTVYYRAVNILTVNVSSPIQ